jgi:hypothetical protein
MKLQALIRGVPATIVNIVRNGQTVYVDYIASTTGAAGLVSTQFVSSGTADIVLSTSAFWLG